MPYRKPTQDRSLITEERFLTSFNELLGDYGFQATTVEMIAEHAGLTKGAFMKRFGSKKRALLLLFSHYADKASALINEYLNTIDHYSGPTELFFDMSWRLEQLLMANFAVNRAMDELFRTNHEWQTRSQQIHFECVDMMVQLQRHYLGGGGHDYQAAKNTAQLLITINFNYVMNAMRSLPSDSLERHRVIADVLAMLLTRTSNRS